jgi:tetratricopeptide (TPR) repeat protein
MMRAVAILLAPVLAMAAQTATPLASHPRQPVESAATLMQAGKYAAAVAPLEAMVRKRPNDSEALLALGICYSQTGKPAEAVAVLQKHVALAPRSSDGRAVLGIVLLAMGRVLEAKPELEQAVRLDSSQAEAVKALARADNLLGKPAAAVALLGPLAASAAADDDAKLLFAQALLKSGDAAAAAAELDRLLASNPRSGPEVYLGAAIARKNLGQLDRAFEICERGMQVHPYSERLETFYSALPLDLFAARMERRLERLGPKPGDVDELIALGRVMINIEKAKSIGAADQAESLLARAIALAPGNPCARHFHARSLLVLGKPEAAVAGFHSALAAGPNAALAILIRTWCGLAETRLTHTDRAEAEYRAAFEANRKLDRHMVDPAFQYFLFLRDSARADEAQRILDEILRWEPYFAPALLERAKQLAARDQPNKAVEQAELALQNVENDPALLRAAHFFLARTYHAMNRGTEARAHEDWIKAH